MLGSFSDEKILQLLIDDGTSTAVAQQLISEFPPCRLHATAIDILVAAGKRDAVKKSRFSPNGSPWASVWLAYLDLLPKNQLTLAVMKKALDSAGGDLESGRLWRKALEIARNHDKEGSTEPQHQRAIFQTALQKPISPKELDSLMTEYIAFETEATGSKRVQLPDALVQAHEKAQRIGSALQHAYQVAEVSSWVVPRANFGECQQRALLKWKQATTGIFQVSESWKFGSDGDSDTAAVIGHFKRLVSLFPHSEEAWAEYLVGAFLCGSDKLGSVGDAALVKCPSSCLLRLLKLEFRGASSSTTETVTAEDCLEIAEKCGAVGGLAAFAKYPDLIKSHKREFRSLGKKAVKDGVTDWLVYKTWCELETLNFRDTAMIKEIFTKVSKKVRSPSIDATQLMLGSQRLAEQQLDTQESLKFHEGVVAELSLARKSAAGDPIMAPLIVGSGPHATVGSRTGAGGPDAPLYVPSDGMRRSAWNRYCAFERNFQGTRPNSALHYRREEELNPCGIFSPSCATLMLRQIENYTVGLLTPVSDDHLKLYQNLSGLAPSKARKEMEERGDFQNPLKTQGLAIEVCYQNVCQQSPSSRPTLLKEDQAEGTSGWKRFEMPENKHPIKANDDNPSNAPMGNRLLRGKLDRKMQLDIVGRRLQRIYEEQEERAQREEASDDPTKQLPRELGNFLKTIRDDVPTIFEITKQREDGRFAETRSEFSALRILGNVHHAWLIQELQKQPNQPLQPPRL